MGKILRTNNPLPSKKQCQYLSTEGLTKAQTSSPQGQLFSGTKTNPPLVNMYQLWPGESAVTLQLSLKGQDPHVSCHYCEVPVMELYTDFTEMCLKQQSLGAAGVVV